MAGHESVIGWYFSRLDDQPLLDRATERSLLERAAEGDRSARDRLIEAHLRYVVRVAGHYRGRGLPFEDLINEGNLGLLEATRRYDPSRGTRFITCADWWIRRAIINALGRQGSSMRVPSSYWRAMRELREAERTLESSLGRSPDRQELGARLDRHPDRVDRLRRINVVELSLDDPELRVPVASTTADCDEGSTVESLIRRETADRLGEAVAELPSRERVVVLQRFGFDGERAQSLQEVGERLNLSRERVRQIEKQACKRLRRWMQRGVVPRGAAESAVS